jgi:hypothetical protein
MANLVRKAVLLTSYSDHEDDPSSRGEWGVLQKAEDGYETLHLVATCWKNIPSSRTTSSIPEGALPAEMVAIF